MDHNAAYLLKHLSLERERVQECWRRMNVQRSVLQRIIERDYSELVNGGLRLYGATTSQAAALSRHIEINGIRYSHISRYEPQPVATVERSDPRVDQFLKECGI
jgi:hypothetical protein